VKAPRVWPNRWDSIRSAGRFELLTTRNGASPRAPCWWIASATSSFPVPLSPWIRTVRPGSRHLLDHPVDGFHAGGTADQLADAAAVRQCAPQVGVLLAQAALGQRRLDQQHDLFVLERLGEEVEGPTLHRLDGRFDRAVRGDHDHLDER